jgi:flavin reductase (DIM6/NTAB) family NADH-FMN oxidoreductase RutF/DNA-binding IclR family transcriptional regulator
VNEVEVALADVMSQVPRAAILMTGVSETGERRGHLVDALTTLTLDPPQVLIVAQAPVDGLVSVADGERLWLTVLAEDQASVVEQLSGREDAFEDVPLISSPVGAPIPEGSLAWLECVPQRQMWEGSTLLVFALVISVRIERNVRPVLEYQGGFGGFLPNALTIASEHGTDAIHRAANAARADMELIASELGVECSVIACEGDSIVTLAAANYSDVARVTRLGDRTPIVPPLGVLFVGSRHTQLTEDAWFRALERLGPVTAEDVARSQAQLQRVRERGWSIIIDGPYRTEDLDAFVQAATQPQHTLHDEDRLYASIRAMAESHEPPNLSSDAVYDVHTLTVPVRSATGDTIVALRVLGLPQQAQGTEVQLWISLLQEAAHSIERSLTA